MSLKVYQKKRNFSETPEPKGKKERFSQNRFVIQEHWASHHHFDFRLEMDGVLKSWAIPKGVPEKKGERRLAIQTENHPVSYIDFQGEIPKGSYGAGIVKIFDKGYYKLIENKPREIIFNLDGKKIRGRYSLILFRKDKKVKQWLIIKNELIIYGRKQSLGFIKTKFEKS